MTRLEAASPKTVNALQSRAVADRRRGGTAARSKADRQIRLRTTPPSRRRSSSPGAAWRIPDGSFPRTPAASRATVSRSERCSRMKALTVSMNASGRVSLRRIAAQSLRQMFSSAFIAKARSSAVPRRVCATTSRKRDWIRPNASGARQQHQMVVRAARAHDAVAAAHTVFVRDQRRVRMRVDVVRIFLWCHRHENSISEMCVLNGTRLGMQ